MGPLLSMASCPNCGAPHDVALHRQTIICIFCNTSLLVQRPAGAPAASPAQLSAQTVAKEDIERVKQLLVDGKRAEAVAHYARVAGVPPPQAEQAVEQIALMAYWTLVHHLPLNAFGFALYAAFILGGLGLAAWAATQALESPAYYVVVAVGLLFGVWQLVRFVPHLSSTFTSSFGATGRARVVRSAVVRRMEMQDGYLIVVLFEVVPDDGTAPFVDQETLFVGDESLRRLSAGNVVRVRFDGARQHVFPFSPVVVLSTGTG